MDNNNVPYRRRVRNGLKRHLLTSRQKEIMDLLTLGELTPPEIERKLFISLRTVQWHITKIRELYDADTLHKLCMMYMKELDNWHDTDV